MEPSQKTYTVESLTELIRQDPEKAFEELQKMSKEEKSALFVALPFAESAKIMNLAITANLRENVANKVQTP